MKFLTSVEENFRFMVMEVTKQVENTRIALERQDRSLREKIESRDDYIDNLKSVIENSCFSRVHGSTYTDKRTTDFIRAVNIVTNNLERMADHAVNIVNQTQYLSDIGFLRRYNCQAFFDEVQAGLNHVVDALIKQNIGLAFRICRCEYTLDELFKENFDQVMDDLRKGESPNDCITAHNILRYLERMGDTLKNVGEAVLFAAVGEKFKIRQYQALSDTLKGKGMNVPITRGEFQSIWGTRSGCRIGKVEGSEDGSHSQGVIFKEGNAAKLTQEKLNIETWETILPGLPPRIQGFLVNGESASMLVEYLSGCTFQEIVLSATDDILENAHFIIRQTVGILWSQTMKPQSICAHPMKQLRSRLPDVFRLHPLFETPSMGLSGVKINSVKSMIDQVSQLEETLCAPFSVFIHGDFNINNIVYNHGEQRIHYIDLHRSCDSDYIQDISVYLVSNFRLPLTDRAMRLRLSSVIETFLNFARRFAQEHGDSTFEARLALGLIRSFITSTRFEFNRKFARNMFLRGVYLMEKMLEHTGPMHEFVLPKDVLVY
ncbi:PhoU domain-containing protein [Desulfovibrio inopinatus]|uniref:PhoU domain-containing protein n=1 Tax=Desulfovibrio inopinatus TaxID=102109 RepID=UPI00041C8C38|nr:PhoU domain-containing protein [Desulfovibrio inopinatus]